LLGVLLVVVFDVFCLLRLGTADTAHFVSRFVWAVLIVGASPLGGPRLPARATSAEAIAGADDHAAKAVAGKQSMVRPRARGAQPLSRLARGPRCGGGSHLRCRVSSSRRQGPGRRGGCGRPGDHRVPQEHVARRPREWKEFQARRDQRPGTPGH
jgi:hypothetical protein